MNKKVNVFLGLAASLMAAIAIFVLFAPMFYDATFASAPGGSEFGNCFQVMFYGYANKVDSKSAVPLLIVAFGLEALGVLFGFIACGFSGKKSILPFAITCLALVGAAVLFLLGKDLYLSVNPLGDYTHELSLGSGCICSIVFALIGALLAVYGAYSNIKD